MNDLRFSLRSLKRSPAFSVVTVLTLALGIGSAAAIFSVVDWVLFQSTRFPQDLVMIGAKTKQSEFNPFSFAPQLEAYRALDSVFADSAVAKMQSANVVVNGQPLANGAMLVSANFLSIVDAVPTRGRGFAPAEEADGRNEVVVITDEFRREAFADAPDVLGRKIIIDQAVCTVVGVLAPRQRLPVYGYAPVYRPFQVRPDAAASWQNPLLMFARLKPGVTAQQAEQAMGAAKVESVPPQLKAHLAELRPRAATIREAQSFMRRDIYWVMFGAVGFLYAIACMNATNLMLVRLLGRQRELSIRLTLGGSRGQLVRLLLCDGAVLTILAGAMGVLVANWLVPVLMALAQSRTEMDWHPWVLDWRALTVLVGLSLTTGIAISVVPTLRILGANLQDGLKAGGAALGETRGLARMRSAFVVLQAAFALILLTGAGLMVRTFGKLEAVPLGFETHQRMKLRLNFPLGYAAKNDERHALIKRLQEHLSHAPGVLAASYGTDTLLPGYYFAPVTFTLPDGDTVKAKIDFVSANFLQTSGMVLRRGRMIAESGGEIMINESFARKRYGDHDPIGQMLHKTADSGSGASDYLVVGLVADVRHSLREEPGYRIYAPETWWAPLIDTFILQVAREPDKMLAASIKRSVYAFDPHLVIGQLAGLDEIRGWNQGMETYVGSVLKVLSGIALALALVGMFSVLAYTVDRRMGEFGVRLALGATSRDLVGLVMMRGVRLALAGVVLGIGGALGLVRYLQSLLYQTPPYDPVVLASVAAMLLGAAVLACALPARRATKVDVAKLLRSE
jgi:putative ABC transport system permease protein